jgi:hypothetical protein
LDRQGGRCCASIDQRLRLEGEKEVTFKQFDVVVATEDIQKIGVLAGAKGSIIDVYPDGFCEVEFDVDADENIVNAALRPDQIALAHPLRQAA